MTIDTAKLKAAAEKATPGPWRRTSTIFNGITYGPFSLTNEKVLANVAEKANAEFIAAANPTAVLELIAALEDAQRSNAALASENAAARDAVQVFCDVVGDNTDAICEVIGKDGVMAILSAMRATGNLPATDAFLRKEENAG